MKIISIGRSENSNIVIRDPKVSRMHAMLRIYPSGKMEIIDRSTNGTFIDNQRITPDVPCKVTRGNVVRFADDQLLDWNEVPSPKKLYKIGACVLLVLAIMGSAYYFISKNISSSPDHNPNPDQEQIVEGGNNSGNNSDVVEEVKDNKENNAEDIVKDLRKKEEKELKKKKEAEEKAKEVEKEKEETEKKKEKEKQEEEAENNNIIM